MLGKLLIWWVESFPSSAGWYCKLIKLICQTTQIHFYTKHKVIFLLEKKKKKEYKKKQFESKFVWIECRYILHQTWKWCELNIWNYEKYKNVKNILYTDTSKRFQGLKGLILRVFSLLFFNIFVDTNSNNLHSVSNLKSLLWSFPWNADFMFQLCFIYNFS